MVIFVPTDMLILVDFPQFYRNYYNGFGLGQKCGWLPLLCRFVDVPLPGMVFSTIKCRIELGTLFSLLCNLVCVNAFATLKMCVYRIEIFAKNSRKSLQNRAKRDFCNVFREFFANIEILYTHTFEVWQKHEHILNCIVAKTKYPVKSYT